MVMLLLWSHCGLVFAVYVGCATVGAAAWWFTMYEKGPQLNYYQLVSTRFCILSLLRNGMIDVSFWRKKEC